MNEQTKQDNFTSDFTFACVVNLSGDDPAADGLIVPKADALATPPVLDNARKLLHITFGEGVESVTFYGPEGNTLFSDVGDGATMPGDDVINGSLNEAWTGNRDSDLMPKVQIATLQLIGHVLLAKQVAATTGASAQMIFQSLSVHDDSLPAKVYGTNEEGKAVGENLRAKLAGEEA